MGDVDLIVIGAGMAGMNAAARAVEAEASVAVIERDRVGGTCPIRGCIPSKALIRSAEIAHEVRNAAAYGIHVGDVRVDLPAVIDRVQAIVDRGANGARQYLESLPGLRLVMGEAAFEEPGVVVVDGERIRAPRVIVATGNTPAPPPIPGLDGTPYLTSSDILVNRTLPERLVVIGAGPIGLELGQAMSRLGARVTLIDVAPRLLAAADPEMGDELAGLLREEGIEILVDAKVERTARRGDGVRVSVTADGATRDVDADAILVGTGWASDVGALHLERAGVDGGPAGVPVDARLQTSQGGHYAAGDVLGAPYGAYTHVARALGRCAASNALDAGAHDVGSDHGPAAIFTDPEFVAVGLTETAAREKGLDIGGGTTRFSGGKARAWGQERGLVKAVVDRATHKILGVQILAYHGADLIHPVVVAMQAGAAEPLTHAFHIHPTLGEPVQGAVKSALA